MKDGAIVRRLLKWFAGQARDLPWRRTRDPYAVWVSEIMLQQTQVKTVLPYWERWMRAVPNIAALAKVRRELLHKLWEGLGYYRRVLNLQRAARIILAEHGGRFPRDFEAVLALPGVGRYTAGAICSIAYNQPKAVLDGNVIRVLARCYGVAGNPREPKVNARLWQLAGQLVLRASETGPRAAGAGQAARGCSQFNQALMELGALVCTPRGPRCGTCPIAKHCVAYAEGRVQDLPRVVRRARVTQRRFVAFVAEKRGRYLVRQRPGGAVNAHLWEFPNVEVAPDDTDLEEAARRVLGVRPERLEALGTIKHSITRYRINLEVCQLRGRQADRIPTARGHWLSVKRLHGLAFTSAHRRILQGLGAA
jgi:A/G-specific adenine glycosylase